MPAGVDRPILLNVRERRRETPVRREKNDEEGSRECGQWKRMPEGINQEATERPGSYCGEFYWFYWGGWNRIHAFP